jgi:hypothetical protein
MASGSRHNVYFVAESTSGVTPANPQLSVFRCTKDSLDVSIKYIESKEIRNDREKGDLTPGVQSIEGALGAELSFGSFDDLIAAALCGDWASHVVESGVLRKSFTFISEQSDFTTGKYDIYRGCEINKISFKENAEGNIEIEFTIVGRTHATVDVLPTGSTVLDRTTTSPMNALTGTIEEGGAASGIITEADISIENGIEPRFVIGSKFSIAPSIKSRTVSGSVSAYFEDQALRQKYLNGTDSSLELTIVDPTDAGKKYIITEPRIKYKSAKKDVGSSDDDIIIKLDYQAQPDLTNGYSIKIERVGAA